MSADNQQTEIVVCAKTQVFVYRVPPAKGNAGYKANDWNLQEPQWMGRMRIMGQGKMCKILLEDPTTGNLFASCPVDQHPSISVQSVADSSRYFVLKVVDEKSGRHAFIGIGFADRGDSFDFSTSLQDFFIKDKRLEQLKMEFENAPKRDLTLKDGQTVQFNLKIANKGVDPKKKKDAPFGGVPRPNAGGSPVNQGSICKVLLPTISRYSNTSHRKTNFETDSIFDDAHSVNSAISHGSQNVGYKPTSTTNNDLLSDIFDSGAAFNNTNTNSTNNTNMLNVGGAYGNNYVTMTPVNSVNSISEPRNMNEGIFDTNNTFGNVSKPVAADPLADLGSLYKTGGGGYSQTPVAQTGNSFGISANYMTPQPTHLQQNMPHMQTAPQSSVNFSGLDLFSNQATPQQQPSGANFGQGNFQDNNFNPFL